MEILRAIKNDQEAPQYNFSELVDECSTSVYRFCRSLTYTKEDAEDLFQETFLKVLQQPHKISAAENPKSFLFSTCNYIWKSCKRKYARRNRIAPAEYSSDEYITEAFTIEEDFIAQEENQIVRRLVDALPDKLKIPTILYYTVEMNVTDIATSLKIPVGTVKSRLFKARKLIEKGLM